MSLEPRNTAIDELIETTAENIIFICHQGTTTDDPKPAIMQLLDSFLDAALEELSQDVIREEYNNEEAQKN